MKKIYLAGNISANLDTYKWRDLATELLKDRYIIINPAANPFNKDLLKKYDDDPEKFKKMAVKKSQGILISKDYQLVMESDIILVNMAIITPEKPLIGTLFELAWSWEHNKPVIAVVGDNWWCKHPFPVDSFSAVADSVEEACDLIKYFFVEG